jgi:hypothetical protein
VFHRRHPELLHYRDLEYLKTKMAILEYIHAILILFRCIFLNINKITDGILCICSWGVSTDILIWFTWTSKMWSSRATKTGTRIRENHKRKVRGYRAISWDTPKSVRAEEFGFGTAGPLWGKWRLSHVRILYQRMRLCTFEWDELKDNELWKDEDL